MQIYKNTAVPRGKQQSEYTVFKKICGVLSYIKTVLHEKNYTNNEVDVSKCERVGYFRFVCNNGIISNLIMFNIYKRASNVVL